MGYSPHFSWIFKDVLTFQDALKSGVPSTKFYVKTTFSCLWHPGTAWAQPCYFQALPKIYKDVLVTCEQCQWFTKMFRQCLLSEHKLVSLSCVCNVDSNRSFSGHLMDYVCQNWFEFYTLWVYEQVVLTCQSGVLKKLACEHELNILDPQECGSCTRVITSAWELA